MLLAWVAAALGVLTKGLVAAAIPAAVLVMYSLWIARFFALAKLHLKWGLPLFLLLRCPGTGSPHSGSTTSCSFFSSTSISRAILTPIADRQEPWWFFGWVFLAGTRALDRAGVARAGARLAGTAARPIQSGSISVDLGGVHLRVFLALRLETHALHLAGHAGSGGADRRAADCQP